MRKYITLKNFFANKRGIFDIMQKETTVLLLCVLVLFADGICFWQTLNLWQDAEINLSKIFLSAIAILQILLAFLIVWLSYFLLRKTRFKQFRKLKIE